MTRQPGLIGGVLHRGVDADGPFQFIDVAVWQSAELLAAGLRSTAEALQRNGIDVRGVFQEMGVTVSQNDYVEEARYTATPDSAMAG